MLPHQRQLQTLRSTVDNLRRSVLDDGDLLGTISGFVHVDKNLVSLASVDHQRRTLLEDPVLERRTAAALVAWRRVLEQSTWYAAISWATPYDDRAMAMHVVVYDHLRARRREVWVCPFDDHPFTFGYLAEVVRCALTDDLTMRIGAVPAEDEDGNYVGFGEWTTTTPPVLHDRKTLGESVVPWLDDDDPSQRESVKYRALTEHTDIYPSSDLHPITMFSIDDDTFAVCHTSHFYNV